MNATDDTQFVPKPSEKTDAPPASLGPRPRNPFAAHKIQGRHLKRMAIIYIRQSTAAQVLYNTESTARQYGLVDLAVDLGWPRSQVEIIDEDQAISGRTVEARLGFQRLLAEVSLDHVGIIVGLEMSKLARCCKDWHQLLELCAIFGTVLADFDGIYDPIDYNDRLLLGLKGTMSEAELHILKGRLNEGKLNKARRGDLFTHVPMGYIKSSPNESAFDPDEQVRAVVHLMFAKFEELGSVAAVIKYFRKHDIKIGIRPHDGPNAGQLEWRRPWASTMRNYFRHPIYAGVYTYGRSQVDPRRQWNGKHGSGRREVPQEEWHAFLRDELPAYISWEQYMANQRQIDNNGSRMSAMRAPREGKSLLAGLLVCGQCGARVTVDYKDRVHGHKYVCMRRKIDRGGDTCQILPGGFIDDFVGAQILQVLQPEPLQLSLQVAGDLQKERERLSLNWRQKIERAQFEARRAEKRYRAVDPENRLVARTLEQEWEKAMRQAQEVEEDFGRFQQACPAELTAEDQERIQALALDVPALWRSPNTNPADRKQLARLLIEKVVATVQNKTEYLDVAIHWAGGFTSQHELIRPVGSYERLRDFEQLRTRVLQLDEEGQSNRRIAEILNVEGFRPAKNRGTFNRLTVRDLLRHLGKRGTCNWGQAELKLRTDEWLVSGLAKELQMATATVHSWIKRRWVHAEREASRFKRWIVWADAAELARLRRLHGCPRRNNLHHPFPEELTTPKPRPVPQCGEDAQ